MEWHSLLVEPFWTGDGSYSSRRRRRSITTHPWEYKVTTAAVLVLIAGLLFLSACWSKFSNRFFVSSGTVSATYGPLSQETHEIDVRDIKEIVLKQSLFGRILDYGTLELARREEIPQR
jgi:uncharacterized membrane protein YdbT with pleckstrin-like domain